MYVDKFQGYTHLNMCTIAKVNHVYMAQWYVVLDREGETWRNDVRILLVTLTLYVHHIADSCRSSRSWG